MTPQPDQNHPFELLFCQWEPKASRCLRARRIPEHDCVDLFQESAEAFLKRFARAHQWPTKPECYLWTILFNLLKKRKKQADRRGFLTPLPPDLPVVSEVPRTDAVMDLRFFLQRYSSRHPKEADSLRIWLIDLRIDVDAAARKIIRNERGDPQDASRVAQVKRRLSAYLARFADCVRHEFPDDFAD